VSNYFVKVSKDNSFAKTTCPFSFPLVPGFWYEFWC
jgi:hypothetical protein